MRTVLTLGAGVIIGIWLFAGSYFMRRLGETERRTAEINVRYMNAQALLSTVRAQILLGSIYLRDALLAPSSETDNSRKQVEQAYAIVSDTLRQYVPILNSAIEQERVERLKAEIDDFRRAMLQVLATDSSTWPADARKLLRTEVVPRRETVTRVFEELQALNRTAFVQQQDEIAALYSASQRQLWLALSVGLAGSLGIALLVAAYAGRLEARIRRQGALDAQHAKALQELSGKLITAQEEERRTISRELHDEVGQVLTAIKVELAVAQHGIESTGGDPALLEDARSITEGALVTVRDLSHLLHPSLLDDLGLPAAVEWYVQGFSRRHNIRVEYRQTGMEERLAPEVEVSFYRIVQEALTNVLRHSSATACSVSLRRMASTVRATIEDNGVGFDLASLDGNRLHTGLGLLSMRERALRLGGALRVESVPGEGSIVTVDLPVWLRSEQNTAQRELPHTDGGVAVSGGA